MLSWHTTSPPSSVPPCHSSRPAQEPLHQNASYKVHIKLLRLTIIHLDKEQQSQSLQEKVLYFIKSKQFARESLNAEAISQPFCYHGDQVVFKKLLLCSVSQTQSNLTEHLKNEGRLRERETLNSPLQVNRRRHVATSKYTLSLSLSLTHTHTHTHTHTAAAAAAAAGAFELAIHSL